MIFLNTSILFFIAFLGGIAFILFPGLQKVNFRNILIFAGSYLLSITILHILPEVYAVFPDPAFIGIFILAGFFLQLILEFLSEGIEHGHTHVHASDNHEIHFRSSHILSLMVGLCIHSFLEGMIVVHPPSEVFHHHSGGIMIGIVLHKIPEALALMTVLHYSHLKKIKVWMNLILFSLASPAGIIFSNYLNQQSGFTNQNVSVLYGIVSGTFLFISTTIFFETSPGHHFNPKKLLFAMAGCTLAIVVELLI